MGWKQPPSLLQYDNSNAVGMSNCALIPRNSKSWDLRLNWVRCREAQKNFEFIGIRVLIITVNTVKSTTQSYTMDPRGPWAFLAVCFILTFVLNVETLCLELIEFQQGVLILYFRDINMPYFWILSSYVSTIVFYSEVGRTSVLRPVIYYHSGDWEP